MPATKASRAESTGKVPAALRAEAKEVSIVCIEGYEKLDNAPEDDPIHSVFERHGIHAYRYEPMDDGSILCLYANDESGEVKLKAFESMEEASKWTPRELRNEE